MLLGGGDGADRSKQPAADGQVPGLEIAGDDHHGAGSAKNLLDLGKPGLGRLPRLAPQRLTGRARKHQNEIPPPPRPQSMLDASNEPRDRLNEMQRRDDNLEREAAGPPLASR